MNNKEIKKMLKCKHKHFENLCEITAYCFDCKQYFIKNIKVKNYDK